MNPVRRLLRQVLHEHCLGVMIAHRQQDMDMVAHQDICMQIAMVFFAVFRHQIQVSLPFLIVMKTGAAIVPALNYMQAAARRVIAKGTDHFCSP
jgi:predicted MFS family arabinose efflux permease